MGGMMQGKGMMKNDETRAESTVIALLVVRQLD